jgi:hypothetical protein
VSALRGESRNCFPHAQWVNDNRLRSMPARSDQDEWVVARPRSSWTRQRLAWQCGRTSDIAIRCTTPFSRVGWIAPRQGGRLRPRLWLSWPLGA